MDITLSLKIILIPWR